MRYANSPVPVDQVARELGVQYVLEGSARRDGRTVRITAQLIQMKDQSHIWARQYDRELSNLLTVQDESIIRAMLPTKPYGVPRLDDRGRPQWHPLVL
jgi:TolB-like protein